jgi:HEPN domain-containing protein/predicted nucleotidyltransferase
MVTQIKPETTKLIPAEAIDELARQIAARFDPERIYLFGSYAYGHSTPDSDVDLMVIMSTDNMSGQASQIRAALRRDFPLDLLVRTPNYFAERLTLGDFFIEQIAWHGKVLYDSDRTTLHYAIANPPVQGPQYEYVGGAYLNKLTAEWVKKGEHDLVMADFALQYTGDDLNDEVCYHAQQCAEKYFKAYLQERGVRSGKTHELDKLLSICETVDPGFAQLRHTVSGKLKDYAVDPRYPGTDPAPDETRIAYHHMMEIRAFIRAKLGI